MADIEFEAKTTEQVIADIQENIIQAQDAVVGKPKLTDFSTGSIIGTLVRGVGAAIGGYWQYFKDLTQSFYITTATGESLRKRFADFNFVMKTGSPSKGTIHIIRPANTTYTGNINSQEILYTDSGEFQFTVDTSTDSFGSPGNTVNFKTVNVTCTENSSLSNLPSGTILRPLNSSLSSLKFIVASTMDGTYTTALSGGLSGGVSDETEDEARDRFKTYIQNLGKGTTSVIKASVEAVSGVRRCKIYDNSRIVAGEISSPYPGYIVVQVQPTDLVSGLSVSLRSRISQAVEESKAAGVAYVIHSVPVRSVNIVVQVRTSLNNSSPEWANYTSKLTTEISNIFNSLDIKEGFYISALQAKLYAVDPGVSAGGITITCTNDQGQSLANSAGNVLPEQSGDGGVLVLGDLDFETAGL